jgi:DNA processing protein
MGDKNPLFLALAEMTTLKIKEKILLEKKTGSLDEHARMGSDEIKLAIKRPFNSEAWRGARIRERVERIIHLMDMFDIGALHIDDGDYPALLKELYDPPFMLFYRGNVGILERPRVSIVGTRYPTREGAEAAFSFAKDAADGGWTVVSGLALGIDSFAHRGALSASDSATCAVLASGVDGIYPVSNKPLARAILAKGGLIASEYAPGTPPAKWRFPARNRIISGLSSATVITDAPEDSGALITADFALEQGRDVYFHEAALCRYECGGEGREEINGDGQARKTDGKKTARDAKSYIASGAPVVSSFNDFLEQEASAAGGFSHNARAELF